METVKIKKQDLVAKLEANRVVHKNTYDTAYANYRVLAIEELEKILAAARDGGKIKRNISLVEPISNIKQYDQILAMLNMSVDDVIELTTYEFTNYCLDEWDWSQQFNATNSTYLNK